MSRDRVGGVYPAAVAGVRREGGIAEPGGREVPLADRWYACYTMARREKKVHVRFRERGIESFLPLVPRISQWHDRKKRIEWPLLPGYVFARFALTGVSRVLGTPGVASIVYMDGRPAAIPEEEVDNIARFARALASTGAEPPPVPFREGQRVRIISGPFGGVEGVVLERRGRRRVLVGLRTIGVGFEVDVEARVLRAVG